MTHVVDVDSDEVGVAGGARRELVAHRRPVEVRARRVVEDGAVLDERRVRAEHGEDPDAGVGGALEQLGQLLEVGAAQRVHAVQRLVGRPQQRGQRREVVRALRHLRPQQQRARDEPCGESPADRGAELGRTLVLVLGSEVCHEPKEIGVVRGAYSSSKASSHMTGPPSCLPTPSSLRAPDRLHESRAEI